MLGFRCLRANVPRALVRCHLQANFSQSRLFSVTTNANDESPTASPETAKPTLPPKRKSKSKKRRIALQRNAARASRDRVASKRSPPKRRDDEPSSPELGAQLSELAHAMNNANSIDAADSGLQAHDASGTLGETHDSGIWTSLRARLQSTNDSPSPHDDIHERNHPTREDVEEIAAPSEDIENVEDVETETPKKTANAKSKRPKVKAALEVKTIKPQRLHLRPVEEKEDLQVPKLSYDLDRVLFNPGVYHMQDARSRVFNFDPYLASIMPIEEFDFDALKSYITSSKDVKLRELSNKHGMKYCGSTSSMTSILSHFHFLLSGWRKPCLDNLSRSFTPDSMNFTALSRGPAAAFARFKDGVYAIDSDKEFDTENVLSMLGKSMEKLLTLSKDDFERYRRSRSHQITEEERNADEAYHFTTMGDFMMRSQLDAHDPRLPGSGMFDLKTRAVVSIRMDVRGYEKGVGYEIRKRFGQWESFEREYYDMIRAAFLKYSLQVRMGRMDGIFVAFHNTQRIFGFQYISLAEMDHAIHGTPDRRIGDQEFKGSLALLNDLLERATKRFPGRSLRLHVETRPTKVPLTYFFAEPVSDEEIATTQQASDTSVEQIERDIRDLSDEERQAESAQAEEESKLAEQRQFDESERSTDDTPLSDSQGDAAWKEMMVKVEEAVENESLGIESVREALSNALEQSGLLRNKTEAEGEQYVDTLVNALTAHSSRSRQARDASSEDGQGVAAQDINDDSLSTASAFDRSEDTRPSLKDLILKVAESIDGQDRTLDSSQRKFAELVSRSKSQNTSPDSIRPDIEGASADAAAAVEAESQEAPQEISGTKKAGLLGMYVTIRNKVNGEFVERPLNTDRLDWTIQYTVTELPEKRAQQIYSKLKKRRRATLNTDPSARSADWYKMFKGRLPVITKQGEKYRRQRTQQEAGNPVYVAWAKEPHAPTEDTP